MNLKTLAQHARDLETLPNVQFAEVIDGAIEAKPFDGPTELLVLEAELREFIARNAGPRRKP